MNPTENVEKVKSQKFFKTFQSEMEKKTKPKQNKTKMDIFNVNNDQESEKIGLYLKLCSQSLF